MKIDLPDGGWAVLRESEDDCPNRLKRVVDRQRTLLFSRSDTKELGKLRAIEDDADRRKAAEALEAELGPVAFADLNDLMTDLGNALAAAMVAEWSYAAPISAAAVDDLPAGVRLALVSAVDRVVNNQPVEDGKAALLDPTPEPGDSSG